MVGFSKKQNIFVFGFTFKYQVQNYSLNSAIGKNLPLLQPLFPIVQIGVNTFESETRS